MIESAGAANEFHLYGGNIASAGGKAVVSAAGAHVHVHGTGTDVLTAAASPFTVLRAVGGGVIHADVSAYDLATGAGGTMTRLSTDSNPASHIHAPYHWQRIPEFTLLNSVNGADTTTAHVSETITRPVGSLCRSGSRTC